MTDPHGATHATCTGYRPSASYEGAIVDKAGGSCASLFVLRRDAQPAVASNTGSRGRWHLHLSRRV